MLTAAPFLYHIPATAIPMLIESAAEANDWRERIDRSALDRLRQWIDGASPEGGEAIERRQTLATSAIEWVRHHDLNDAGIAALALAFTPEFRCYETDPGIGRTVTIRSGCLGPDAIVEIGAIWNGVVAALEETRVTCWKPFLLMVSEWACPGRYLRGDPQSDEDRKTRAAILDSIGRVRTQMVADIANLSGEHPGVHHALVQLPSDVSGCALLRTDETFGRLYYDSGYDDGYEERNAENAERVRAIAMQWVRSNPKEVAERINRLQHFAYEAGVRSDTSWHWVLSDTMAREATHLSPWVEALLTVPVSANSLGPFLSEAIRRDSPDTEELISRVMAHPRAFWAGIEAALIISNPTPALLVELEAMLGTKTGLEFGYRMRDTPIETVRRLLESPTPHVAGRAAIGEWSRGSEHGIREELREAWESAVVRAVEVDHIISRICEQRPLLGYEWIRTRLSDEVFYWHQFDGLLGVASRVFSADQRVELLKQSSDAHHHQQVIHALVSLDADVYKRFVRARGTDCPNIAPLERYGLPDFQMDEGAWVQVARVALDHGADPDQIAARCLYPHGVFSREADLWKDRMRWYESLASDEHEGIQAVGRRGSDLACERLQSATREERDEKLRGI